MRLPLLSLVLTALLAGLVPATAEADRPSPFRAMDVVVDVGRQELAAWQVDVTLAKGSLLVGIEGGVAPFAEPAHHDPRALQSRRVVLAAFSTATTGDLPTGRVRVARLHLHAGDRFDDRIELRAAADAQGRRIAARVFLVPVETPHAPHD